MRPSGNADCHGGKTRLRSTDEPDVGRKRYDLIRAAAERIRDAQAAGFNLEATTLIEGLLAERLEKRAQWFWDSRPDMRGKALGRVKDGFSNLGPLTSILATLETAQDFRDVIAEICNWSKERNTVIHEMAKLGQGARDDWHSRYNATQAVVASGIAVLLKLDLCERRDAHLARSKRFASATCPDALGSLGQPVCEWCEAPARPETPQDSD